MAFYLDLALDIGELNEQTGGFKATPYFEDYLHSIIQAVGGEGSETINDIDSSAVLSDKVPYLTALVLSLRKKVAHLEGTISGHIVEAAVRQLQVDTAQFNTLIKISAYTAKNKDYVEGRGNITLKFPENPRRGDEVIFANGNGGTITLDGNGNIIKYTATDTKLIMRQQGTSLHFHYFEDNVLNERYWRAR
tara:strand:- start:1823 stop:2398 length:576 start_codon:yes stop_codon:yes gene_type:complete